MDVKFPCSILALGLIAGANGLLGPALAVNAQNADPSHAAALAAARQNYDAVDLKQLPSEGDVSGADPKTLAVEMFAPEEISSDEAVDQTVTALKKSNLFVVGITQTGLPDDSLQGLRYRVEFVPTNETEWQLSWVGKQYLCQPGRGSQDWTTQPCS